MPSLPRFRFSRTGAIPWRLAPALTAWLAILSGGVARAELSGAAFGDPPSAARPSALWTWLNRHVEPPRITGELEEIKAKGMRGAIICNNRIVGGLRMGLDKGFTRTNLSEEFTAKSPLLPSGLIGPVTVEFPVQATTTS